MDNILEKYRDAVEEYAAFMQKQTVELLKDFDLTQSEIDEYYSRYKTDMIACSIICQKNLALFKII